jgi:hypothetical protein
VDLGTPNAMEEVIARPPANGVVEDLIEALAGGADVAFERTVAFGGEWFAAGCDAAGLAHEIAAASRALEERLVAEGQLDDAGRGRLARLVTAATGRAFEAFVAAARLRRDGWLSYFTHEMRNALNTLVNAHWILKNSEGKQPGKVLDMADRAVRRLETAVKGVRELESQVGQPAPGRQA